MLLSYVSYTCIARLQKYLSSEGVDNVEVYMKVQWKQLKGPRCHSNMKYSDHMLVYITRYHKMDVTRGLRENLSHKTVVEYPTLHVCIAQSPSTAHYIVYDRSVDNGMWLILGTCYIVYMDTVAYIKDSLYNV